MNDPLVYEPAVPQGPAAPPVEYEIVKAVTGKVDKKTPVTLQDAFGNKLHAPWAPKPKCNRCHGRGFVGVSNHTKELVPCRKCYPWKK